MESIRLSSLLKILLVTGQLTDLSFVIKSACSVYPNGHFLFVQTFIGNVLLDIYI